jgi:HEAT repeat protein
MAQYPFDQKFRDTIKSLCEAEYEEYPWIGWDSLITYPEPNGEEFQALTKAGYSNETIKAAITAIKELPVPDLIELALQDELEYSPALVVLQASKERVVLETALKLTKSDIALERELAVLILMRTPGLTYKDEAVAAVTAMLATENDDSTSSAMAYAVSHLDIYDCYEFLARVAQSPNPSTRNAAAYALGSRLGDDLAVKTLITLSQDIDDDIRNWATFGLHNGLEQEPSIREDIREALFANIDDTHEETRYEAIEGLAICKDPRVIGPLIAAFELDEVWDIALEAAIALGHPALHPALVKLNERIPNNELIEKALSACTPKAEE